MPRFILLDTAKGVIKEPQYDVYCASRILCPIEPVRQPGSSQITSYIKGNSQVLLVFSKDKIHDVIMIIVRQIKDRSHVMSLMSN